jgi:hypothetical protein
MDLIYQPNPVYSKPSMFPPKSWTESIEGYINKAKQLTTCLIRNRRLMKRPYTWLVTISFDDEMEPGVITATWTKIKRRLQNKGIVCLWVREPSLSNTIHYHLLLANRIGERELGEIMEACLPKTDEMRRRVHLGVIQPKDWLVHFYVTKAKVAVTTRHGYIEDYFADKRRLFQPKIKLQKYGTIGKFWVKPKKALEQEIAAEQETIAEALEKQEIRRYVKHIYDLLCETVPMKKIERSVGLLAARDASLLAYIEQLALKNFDYWAWADE